MGDFRGEEQSGEARERSPRQSKSWACEASIQVHHNRSAATRGTGDHHAPVIRIGGPTEKGLHLSTGLRLSRSTEAHCRPHGDNVVV